MAQLSCGDGGSTGAEIVDQINTNTNSVADHETRIATNEADITGLDTRVTANETAVADHETRITTNETAVADHETRITINESAIATLQNSPRATLHTSAPTDQTIGDIPVKLTVFDEAVTSRGGFSADTTDHRLINDSAVDQTSVIVSIGINVRFSGTEIIDFYAYINGVQYSPSEFSLRGEGTNKPQAIFWQSDLPLNAGDFVEIWAVNGADSSNITVTFERTQFRMEVY